MRWRRSRRSGTRTRPRSMATSLCSALVLAALPQAPPPPPPAGDSLLALRARLARDSTDGRAWLRLGRLYLQLAEDAHGPPHRALEDSAAVRALLDSSDDALARAGQLLAPSGSTPDGDSARVLRVGAWSARSRLAWDEKGINVGPQEWGPVPLDLKVPPVLEELGENRLGDATPGVGGRAALEGGPRPAARLRVRGAAPGTRQSRRVGPTRAGAVRPRRPCHAPAVRSPQDVQVDE